MHLAWPCELVGWDIPYNNIQASNRLRVGRAKNNWIIYPTQPLSHKFGSASV
jgi:hypothetical protein